MVCNIVRATTVKQNITPHQRGLLRDLKGNKDLHISIADKTAEFVVMKNVDHIRATKLHFDYHAYTKVEMPETEKEVTQFIRDLTMSLENRINTKWKEVCNRRGLSQKFYELFAASHTSLPTGRIQIKTHKHRVSEISTTPVDSLKVRPIVANCNSPMDRITIFICHML